MGDGWFHCGGGGSFKALVAADEGKVCWPVDIKLLRLCCKGVSEVATWATVLEV